MGNILISLLLFLTCLFVSISNFVWSYSRWTETLLIHFNDIFPFFANQGWLMKNHSVVMIFLLQRHQYICFLLCFLYLTAVAIPTLFPNYFTIHSSISSMKACLLVGKMLMKLFFSCYSFKGPSNDDLCRVSKTESVLDRCLKLRYGNSPKLTVTPRSRWWGELVVTPRGRWCGELTVTPRGRWCGESTMTPSGKWCGELTVTPRGRWCGELTMTPSGRWCGELVVTPHGRWCGELTLTPRGRWCGELTVTLCGRWCRELTVTLCGRWCRELTVTARGRWCGEVTVTPAVDNAGS